MCQHLSLSSVLFLPCVKLPESVHSPDIIHFSRYIRINPSFITDVSASKKFLWPSLHCTRGKLSLKEVLWWWKFLRRETIGWRRMRSWVYSSIYGVSSHIRMRMVGLFWGRERIEGEEKKLKTLYRLIFSPHASRPGMHV